MASQEINRSYFKLAQICNFLRGNYPEACMVKNILMKEGDINFKIPSNRCIGLTEPKLIGCTALHIAAIENDSEMFDILVMAGANFTIQNEEGRTALHCLLQQLRFSRSFVIKILLMHLSLNDARNPCDNNGLSHFHIACMYNRDDVVQFLLESGISVDTPVNSDAKKFAGYSPLHFAVENKAWGVMKVLLNHKANMNAKDARGLTPLHLVLEEKIRALDLYGASRDSMPDEMIIAMDDAMDRLLDSENIDNIGLTHFHVACTQRDLSIAEYFLEQGINIDQAVSTNSPIRPGYSALHFAVHCNFNAVKMLLKNKANYELEDANGVTPINLMFDKFSREKIRTIITRNWNRLKFPGNNSKLLEFYNATGKKELLTGFFVKVNDLMMTTTGVEGGMQHWVGYTLLHFAVMFSNDIDIIAECLEEGLNLLINVQDSHNSTPIHLAFRMKRLDIVELLMDHCEGHNLRADDGLSYLHIACALQMSDPVRLFSLHPDIGMPYRGTSTYGLITPNSTPLHVAMATGNTFIIRMLLECELNLEAIDANNETPFHRFLKLTQNTEAVCDVLLKSKALTDDLLENFGLTRLHLAIYVNDFEVREFINRDNIETVVKCKDSSSFFFPFDGCTPLHMSIKRNSKIEIVKNLLEQSANLLMKNEQGDTPFYEALTRSSYHDILFKEIISKLQYNEALRRQIKEMSGITMLHIDCHMVNRHDVNRLISEGANVNARIKSDCPFWPDCTPLHVLVKDMLHAGYSLNNVRILLLEMLLEAEADVIAMDANNQTPIHLSLQAFVDQYSTSIGKKLQVFNANPVNQNVYTVVIKLLDKLRVFYVNPVDRNGISHFHAACLVNNVKVVKAFLENGVDVNQPIDFFANYFAGETPLHLAVDHRTEMLSSPESKREIVQLLLTNGADVKAQDNFGFTALHKAVSLSDNLDILEMLVGYGAPLDVRNIFQQTPLEWLLQSKYISVEKLKFFAKYDCRLNDSNPSTEEGYLSMLISKTHHPKYKEPSEEDIAIASQYLEVMISAVDSFEPDNMGRNLIHNIVSTNDPCWKIIRDGDMIKRVEAAGVDIDLQDMNGRTALHLAAQFGNLPAVEDLLNNGADINVLDAMDRPALQYAIEYYNNDKSCLPGDWHKRIIKNLVIHMNTLEQLKLEVHENNINFKKRALKNILGWASVHSCLDANRRDIVDNLMVVDQPKLLVIDFLSETGKGLTSYPFVSVLDRRIMRAFFRDYNGYLNKVLALQYRKAVKRERLVELVIDSLFQIVPLDLRINCIELIVQDLKNSELENFIKATDTVD